ncbi:hypothetical protein B0T26DRAFT_752143 [Lasiosphaeria miniovina]|uniref:Nuclear segregation protein n=1 Tax=Lasiosphaeria miniovina TaxID=1954250 RepID=A0AA40DVT2_9PEZI|nr:uncharacterized protein B0T26DRAFT_752143 [Lasiosphaeria miniovina]KAK0718189.1 hypothetical protein B0T26DRAFT_752143 [Lasiosphaeria miniovina]
MADDATAAATAAAAAGASLKPVKPDTDLFNEQLGKAEKEYQDVMARYNAVKAKIELATPSKNKDAPSATQKRRQELIAQVNEIRAKQATGKNSRNAILEKIKRFNEQLSSRLTENKVARGKVGFKNTDEIDQEIASLQKKVDGGMMKLVDEKKALSEISNLYKQKKNFTQFDQAEKEIADLKAKIKATKDELDDPEAKKNSEEYNKLQAELDAIKADQDEAYKGLSSLRDERTKLQAEQNEKFQAIRKLKDEYYGQKKAHTAWEREQRERVRERHQAERDRIAKERKMDRAQKLLAEASDPAYLEEIRRARSLLHFFDPSLQPAEKAPLVADRGLTAPVQRKVDDSGIKGIVLKRKEDREDEYLPATKGKKKGKKATPSAASAKTYSCPPSVMEDCAFMGIDPPMSAADVPVVVEKVKAKLDSWVTDQPEQTRKNIEKAKKEIERLEAEEAGEAPTPTSPKTPNGANGKKSEDSEAVVAEVTEGVEKVEIEKETAAEPVAA